MAAAGGNTGRRVRTAVDGLARQGWLDRVAKPLQAAAPRAFAPLGSLGRPAQDALHGTWLGHALHPTLVALPIGAWATAIALDAAEVAGGRRDVRGGADLAILAGLVSALPTVLSGYTDWQYAEERARRIGAVHASGNALAAGLFTASLLARKRGERGRGRAYALGGMGVLALGGYLGGTLVEDEHMGVNHAGAPSGPAQFIAVLQADALPEGQPHRASAEGLELVLVREGGAVHALLATCSHMGGPLDEGTVVEGCIECPWHGSRFDLATGSVERGPSPFGQPCFEVRTRDGQIEVRLAQA